MNDWLGNTLELGDLVVYTSKSSKVGMGLGELVEITASRIQIKPIKYSAGNPSTKIISLHSYTIAYWTVTKYNGDIPS